MRALRALDFDCWGRVVRNQGESGEQGHRIMSSLSSTAASADVGEGEQWLEEKGLGMLGCRGCALDQAGRSALLWLKHATHHALL